MRLVALKKCESEWGRFEVKEPGLHNIGDGVGILWLFGQHRGRVNEQRVILRGENFKKDGRCSVLEGKTVEQGVWSRVWSGGQTVN